MRHRLAAVAALTVFGLATTSIVRADTQDYIVNGDDTSQVKYQIKCGTGGAWRTVFLNPHMRQAWNDCETSFYVRWEIESNRYKGARLHDGTVNTFTWDEDQGTWDLTERPMRDDE